jgi:cobalt/nickel transport system permease protein
MHIPDGFLSPPVWATLDVTAVGSVALVARRAQREIEGSGGRRVALLGVMGAFVFAAQMINFPVGMGTSGHLVGGALLAVTLGPGAAAMVMTAILILQAFVLQDGGILALGANVCNMALAGVLAGYLPYRLWGRGRSRNLAMFAGGLASVAVSAGLALAELRISGVPMPRPLLWISFGVFLAGGIIEGAITVAAVRAIERLNPLWIREPAPLRPRRALGFALAAALVVTLGIAIASSSAPDALQNLLPASSAAPAVIVNSPWPRKAFAGLAAMMLIYAACAMVGRRIARQRSA